MQADLSQVTVRILDDGDVSPPAAPRKPSVVRATGGVLELSTVGTDPSNTGGTSEIIERRTIRRVQANGVLVDVPLVVSGLRELTTYQFVSVVANSLFESAASPTLVVSTTRATPPSAPQNLRLTRRTGGLLRLAWDAPTDLGGVDLLRYVVHAYKVDNDGQVRVLFRKA